VPADAPPAEPVEDDWGGFATAGKKKKGKKGKAAEPEPLPEPEPEPEPPAPEPEPEPPAAAPDAAADDMWGFATTTKKKKGKKGKVSQRSFIRVLHAFWCSECVSPLHGVIIRASGQGGGLH